jgi:uncharacterized protein YycO
MRSGFLLLRGGEQWQNSGDRKGLILIMASASASTRLKGYQLTRYGPQESVATPEAMEMTETPKRLARPGDFMLTHSSGWYGAVIRIGEAIRYRGKNRIFAHWSHAAIFVDDYGNIIEALAGGVQKRNISVYHSTEYVVVHLPEDTSSLDRQQAVAFADFYLNDAYGWLTIISVGLSLLAGAKIGFGVDGQQICSALVARCLERIGEIFPEGEPWHLMPADVAKHFAVELGGERGRAPNPDTGVQYASRPGRRLQKPEPMKVEPQPGGPRKLWGWAPSLSRLLVGVGLVAWSLAWLTAVLAERGDPPTDIFVRAGVNCYNKFDISSQLTIDSAGSGLLHLAVITPPGVSKIPKDCTTLTFAIPARESRFRLGTQSGTGLSREIHTSHSIEVTAGGEIDLARVNAYLDEHELEPGNVYVELQTTIPHILSSLAFTKNLSSLNIYGAREGLMNATEVKEEQPWHYEVTIFLDQIYDVESSTMDSKTYTKSVVRNGESKSSTKYYTALWMEADGASLPNGTFNLLDGEKARAREKGLLYGGILLATGIALLVELAVRLPGILGQSHHRVK